MGLRKYLWILVFFFISIVGMGRLTFNISESYFLPQTYLMIFIGIVALISFMGIARSSRLAYAMFVIIFITLIIDLIYIRVIVDKSSIIFSVALLASALGLIISIGSAGSSRKTKMMQSRPKAVEIYEEKPVREMKKEQKSPAPAAAVKKTAKKKKKSAKRKSKKKVSKKAKAVKKASASPQAKFVASSAGKKYHVKRCGNAKKIPSKKRVYFRTKEDAESQGFTSCRCIK